MRNHIAIKFVAIFLAALSLFVAVGSGAGIIALTASDLYNNSVDSLYDEQMASTRRTFAVNLAHRYASTHLGNCSESYLDTYYGTQWYFDTFVWDHFFYTIKNEKGEVVETTVSGDMSSAAYYSILVTDIRYRSILSSSSLKTEGKEPTHPEEEPIDPQPTEKEVFTNTYYDAQAGSYVEVTYQYENLPPYTVELYLLPDAMPEEQLWSLLKVLWQYRYDLFYLLGLGLLLFAVTFVYLCCAAGRRPGSDQVRAGGLNRIPLDIYAGAVTGIGVVLVALGSMTIVFLQRRAPMAAVLFGGLIGYLCCLLLVGFFFACAAQFKTGNGFWWRHSAIGWVLRQILRVFRLIKRGCRAVLRTLPLMWQWLLTAFAMVVITGVSVILWFTSYSGLAEFFFMCCTVTSVIGCIAVVCYGGWCMATLIRGARFMAQGNLYHQIPTTWMVGAFRDCAVQLNALAGAASIAAERQLRSERMKTELITNVSHDIKTPLTSIINYVDLMKKPHTEEEHRQYLEVLDRQSQRLKKLVDDLMEMSKASTGNMSVDITRIHAEESVNQALGEFADKLERAELIPVVRAPEHPVFMKADGKLVWRVMSNLLSNAVKYALPGTRLYIDIVELESSVVISFKNISREELNVSAEDLMERFVRGDASRNTEGSGLGLNIAKSLMELQGGTLQLLVDGDLFKVTLIFPADGQ